MVIGTSEAKVGYDDIWVALDLETTGLDPESDDIIEVGAVKFQNHEVLDRLQTFVNPYRQLPDFVRRLTGITQREVDEAPPFAAVAGDLARFIGASPVVGHNVAFDLEFLARKGLRITVPPYDTRDLASVVMPTLADYSLGRLAAHLGVQHPRPHRAIEDADVTRIVFLRLLEKAVEMDPGILAGLANLAARSPWPARHLLARLEEAKRDSSGLAKSTVGPLGIDSHTLQSRFGHTPALSPKRVPKPVDGELLKDLLGEDGPLTHGFPGFEHRSQQIEMLQAVTAAMNQRHHLVVEAGTGVGKTLAYLAPAMAYALQNNARVVVSTNTINLQEQLIHKDIPDLAKALGQEGGISWGEVKAAQLKGRANYLCFRRWAHLVSSSGLSTDEARVASRLLVWMQNTATGDRGDLSMSPRDAQVWDKLSAQGAGECLAREGVCFLRHAREKAAGAHIVVVNHALLLTDLAMGGGLIPEYDTLIVDEAHHLESEATKHLGFQVSQATFDRLLEDLGKLLQDMGDIARTLGISSHQRERLRERLAAVGSHLPKTRERCASLFAEVARFIQGQSGNSEERGDQLRVTRATREQPGWSHLEGVWEDADLAFMELARKWEDVQQYFDDIAQAQLQDHETLVMESGAWLEAQKDAREKLKTFLVHPQEDVIYWLSREGRDAMLTFNAAPLHVGPKLNDLLFSKKGCVILTSATLSTQGAFDYLRERVGLKDAKELLLGSPFDYPHSVLLLVPPDVPDPRSWDYQTQAHGALVELAKAARGRVLALFTSNASLRDAHNAVRGRLESDGIHVLGQGVDGSPAQVLRAFVENPRALLLGSSSFWEGVDMPKGLVKVLVVMRLPFDVPTDPVFAARAELLDDSFHRYAVPQAVLRFRQGFGRLIRRKGDRGVVVVLDGRLSSRSYGRVFLGSIPRCTTRSISLREMLREVRAWLEADNRE